MRLLGQELEDASTIPRCKRGQDTNRAKVNVHAYTLFCSSASDARLAGPEQHGLDGRGGSLGDDGRDVDPHVAPRQRVGVVDVGVVGGAEHGGAGPARDGGGTSSQTSRIYTRSWARGACVERASHAV